MPRKRILPDVLADNLKRMRKSRGLTQDEVTKALNDKGVDITRQSYNRYENNNAGPDYDTLIKLAEIFGTDVNSLVGFTEKDETSNDKDKMKNMIFDMITSDLVYKTFNLYYDKYLLNFTFKLPARESLDSNGRFVLSPEGEVEFTEEQLTTLYKVARKAWDDAFLYYFLRIIRMAKDNQPIDEFIAKLQDRGSDSEGKTDQDIDTEINKEASFTANNMRI